MQNSLSAGLAFCFGSKVLWVDAILLILKAEPVASYGPPLTGPSTMPVLPVATNLTLTFSLSTFFIADAMEAKKSTWLRRT